MAAAAISATTLHFHFPQRHPRRRLLLASRPHSSSSSGPTTPPSLRSWNPRRPPSVLDSRSHLTSHDEDNLGTMGRIIEKLQHLERRTDDAASRHQPEDGELPGTPGELDGADDDAVLFPWEKPRVRGVDRKREKTMVAELTLPEGELRRLRHLAMRIKSKTKVSGTVSGEVVKKIREKWKTEEVVRVKVEGDLALNMKRVHHMLEVRMQWASQAF